MTKDELYKIEKQKLKQLNLSPSAYGLMVRLLVEELGI